MELSIKYSGLHYKAEGKNADRVTNAVIAAILILAIAFSVKALK